MRKYLAEQFILNSYYTLLESPYPSHLTEEFCKACFQGLASLHPPQHTHTHTHGASATSKDCSSTLMLPLYPGVWPWFPIQRNISAIREKWANAVPWKTVLVACLNSYPLTHIYQTDDYYKCQQPTSRLSLTPQVPPGGSFVIPSG